MKSKNPVNSLAAFILMFPLFICGLLAMAKGIADSKTPMDRHIEYILERHNDNCQYEIGECPQLECSHYHN
jgi:hypothetical protein